VTVLNSDDTPVSFWRQFLVAFDWYQKLVSVSYILVPVSGAGLWRQKLADVSST